LKQATVNTLSEENHLKALFILSRRPSAGERINTNRLAQYLENRAASVTDMMKRLAERGLVDYRPYKGIALTEEGVKQAASIIRKHRLWETFLVEKLGFSWGEVHDIAEQLEHINSQKLIDRIDALLGYPERDPHGDPIPRSDGSMPEQAYQPLSEVPVGRRVRVARVIDDSPSFLEYLGELGLSLGQEIHVKNRLSFDGSTVIQYNRREATVSPKAGALIWVGQT
jgi:DtxR family Mn-dependent transcriptional regulator